MSMAQRYAGYLEREAFKAATPVKAEAMRQAAGKLREIDKENRELRETVDYLSEGMRDVFPVAHRLALELECLLLSSNDTAAVSKWWDSAHEALEQWREFCREDGKVGAAWRAANPDKVKANNAAWSEANSAASRVHKHNRRARKLEVGGKLSSGLTAKLFRLQKGKCACGCKQPLGADYHRDHIMPLALGGTNTDDNMQLLRKLCNLQKHAKHPIDFMQSRGFLL